MPAILFDGKAFANRILKKLSTRVKGFKNPPRLGIFYFSGHPSSESYVKAKILACQKIGIIPIPIAAAPSLGEARALSLLQSAAEDPRVTALIIVKPAPPRFNLEKFLALIPASKDAEGLHPLHYGRLFSTSRYREVSEKNLIVPPTAAAVALILKTASKLLRGKKVAILGRSAILGTPAAHLLTGMDLTVTLCHSKTKNLASEIRQADVLISGIGHPGIIHGTWLKKGVVVIDAGINVVRGIIRGDVDFNSARAVSSFITPVPGGVGPVTTALALKNVLSLAEEKQRP